MAHHPWLQCEFCFPEERDHRKHCMRSQEYIRAHLNRNSVTWLDDNFVCTFTNLAKHYFHSHEVLATICSFPNENNGIPRRVIVLPPTVRFIAVTVFKDSHYAVLQFDCKTLCITVHNGSNVNPEHWQDHVWFILYLYGLQSTDNLSFPPTINPRAKLTPNPTSWTARIANDMIGLQIDVNNCGPLACLVMASLLGGELNDKLQHPHNLSVDQWRTRVKVLHGLFTSKQRGC